MGDSRTIDYSSYVSKTALYGGYIGRIQGCLASEGVRMTSADLQDLAWKLGKLSACACGFAASKQVQ